jgi:hypothetical protein
VKIGLAAKRDNFFPQKFWDFRSRGCGCNRFQCEQVRSGMVLPQASFIFQATLEKWEKIFSFIQVDVGYNVRLKWTIFVSG